MILARCCILSWSSQLFLAPMPSAEALFVTERIVHLPSYFHLESADEQADKLATMQRHQANTITQAYDHYSAPSPLDIPTGSTATSRRPSASSIISPRPRTIAQLYTAFVAMACTHMFQFCQHCEKLLVGVYQQGEQCLDCKINVHSQCAAV